MRVDGGLGMGQGGDTAAIAKSAKRVEEMGYDGAWSAETSHDPFLPHVIAASTPSASSWAPASPWPSPATR